MRKIPNLEKVFQISFKEKPLLVGGLAKEFYSIRRAGQDIDWVISKQDHLRLEKKLKKEGLKYLKRRPRPGYKKTPLFVNLFGDRGISIQNFEIWDQILGYEYRELSERAIELKYCKIVALEKLIFLTALGIKMPKYQKDLKKIVKKFLKERYEQSS